MIDIKNNAKSFDFLEKLSFVRTAGSSDEAKAAELIKEEALKYTDDVVIEEFEIDNHKINSASLIVEANGESIDVECVGVGLSGSGSVSGEMVYIPNTISCDYYDLEGKIVLYHNKLIGKELYTKLVEKKVAGIIMATGSVYLSDDEVDIDPYQYRDRNINAGKILAVCVRMKKLEELLRLKDAKCTITLSQDELKVNSRNVVATIEGSSKKEEVVCFSAHFDSVSYSKGAYDNATGSTTILEMLAYYSKHTPLRTLKFIWCGAEEMGLLGSKSYCETHKEDLGNYKLNINVDMTGCTIGYDIACCTSPMSLVHYLKYVGGEVGFPIEVRQGVYSSDSTPFADCGVSAISFARMAPRGGAEIHSHRDVLDYLEPVNYYNTCNFIKEFANRIIYSKVIVIEKEMPKEMKEQLDKYLNR